MARRFFANVNLLFFTQVVNRILLFITSVIIARGLGPDGRGDYALFVLTVMFVATLGSLGTGLGSTYYVGKRQYDVRVLLGNSQFMVLVAGALTAAALAAIGLSFEPKAFVEGRSFWLYAFAVPVTLEFVLVTAILLGGERFLALNLSAVGQALLLVIGVAVLWTVDRVSIFSVLAVWILSYAAGSALALSALGFRQLSLKRSMRPDIPVLGEQVRFGLPGQLGGTLTRLNYRLDQYIVRAFRTRAEVGFYAVAAGLAEAVWWIANAVSMALLPRLTRAGSERAREITPIACRNTLLMSLLAAGGLAAAAPVAVELFFGNDFGPAVQPVFWLLPGIVALSGTKVLGSYFFSQARLTIVTIISSISLGATLVFDFLLIPEFGISGAAAASSVAYSTSFAVALYYYRQISGNSAWSCVFPRTTDLMLYADLARRIRRPGVAASATGAEQVGIGGGEMPQM